MFQNQNTANNGGGIIDGASSGKDAAGSFDPSQQQNINYNGMPSQQQQQQQSSASSRNARRKPYVKITEQPASKALRFRYECEGRSAGSIPGANSTSENKTYPTIEIVGYKGRAVVVVSCVTKEAPYRPHPHNLVGKEGCKKGVCTLEINSETMRAVFSNLGIQCVKKKDIEAALRAREEIRVDPFKTGFSHRFQPSSIDLNSVRLCFQVFMESDQKGRFTQPLPPVVSEPIFDKKAMSDLVICRLCSCSATVLGNTQIILLCEKVTKEDITVRFFEEKNDQVVWEAFGEFQHTDVHKQTAIAFKTPRYHTLDITEPAKVFIQLRRPSDGVTSESLPFEYIPLDSGRQTFWTIRRNLKRKPELDVFQEVLAADAAMQNSSQDAADAAMDKSLELVEDEKRRSENEIDNIIEQKVRELEQLQQNSAATAETVVDNASVNEWLIQSNEKSDKDEPMLADDNNMNSTNTDEDKTLNDLLEQVAELDEIYSDHVLRRDTYNKTLLNELSGMDTCMPAAEPADGAQLAMDLEENFDDAATYSSLQIAFKNSVLPMDVMPPTPPASQMAVDDEHYDPVEVRNKPPLELQGAAPPRPAPPSKTASPHMHVTAAEEEKLPPLPPKRLRKQDSNAENRASDANLSSDTASIKSKNAPIIIMKTPDHSPPTKKLPPKPGNAGNSHTLPRPKKQGFFSKLFSRRKSKTDMSQQSEQSSMVGSKAGSSSIAASPNDSREPSIAQFNINDSHRASFKSLQPASLPTSPSKSPLTVKSGKTSKPVGRSVSSVSGKRPTHLNADVIHIPLKGESMNHLPQHNEAYSNSSTITIGNTLDRRTVSALQLADIPLSDGNLELVAIADRQSLRNLCEGEFNIVLDPDVDLTEAEHYALYTTMPPLANNSEFDEASAYYAAVDAGEILTPDEIAKRLEEANRNK